MFSKNCFVRPDDSITAMVEKLRPYFCREWWLVLEPFLRSDDGLIALSKYTAARKAKQPVYPQAKDLFNVFATPISRIKVVIVGNEPYNNNNAHGYAFSSIGGPPYSLQVILKEVYRTHFQKAKIGGMNEVFCCGDLRQWQDQGVFLINKHLSVGAEPESHSEFGWDDLTDKVIAAISDKTKQPVVFMLWGNKAQKSKELINKRHLIVNAHHPDSERFGKKFIGSDVFLEADEFLKKHYDTMINWGVWPSYVDSMTFLIGQSWKQTVPTYFSNYFVNAFGKNWKQELTETNEKALRLLTLALGDNKFRSRFKFDNSNLYMEDENALKLYTLMKNELLKNDANKIWLDEK